MSAKPMRRVSALGLLVIAACSAPTLDDEAAAEPPPVVVRSAAASPIECPHGGTVVSSGLDNDGDGALDDAEVVNRSVVCIAAPMQQPLVIRVRLVAEPRGAHCPGGGTAVQSGPDQNRNGVLDDSEVAQVDYACGQVLLTRLAAEPAGPNCSIGGVAFLAGRDRDANGELEDTEVEARSFECGDVVARDVTIATDADVAALADVRIITGTLVVNAAFDLGSVALPKLEHVGGSLRIPTITAFSSRRIALPRLREVDGALQLLGGLLREIDCPQLLRVGSFSIKNTTLTDLTGFPALLEVDGDVTISFNTALVSADLPLVAIGGDVEIIGNAMLAGLTWRLEGRVGNVSFSGNPSVTSIDFKVAPRDGSPSQIRAFTLFEAAALTQFTVGADRMASLRVNFSPRITDIAIDVGTFDGDLTVFGITQPFHLNLTSAGADHITVGKQLIVSSPLERFDVAAPVTVGEIAVFDNTLLTEFNPGSPVTARGGLRFSDNAQLRSVAPVTLLPTATLQVTNNRMLRRIDFLSLTDRQIGGMLISNNSVLADARSLNAVTVVHGDVGVERNPALTALFGASLQRIEGSVVVGDNSSLGALSYPLLAHVSSTFIVERNAVLRAIEVPALTEVADTLLIRSNPQLRRIVFDALTRAGLFVVTNNPRLPACEVLAIFAHVTGSMSQSGNDNTAPCAVRHGAENPGVAAMGATTLPQ